MSFLRQAALDLVLAMQNHGVPKEVEPYFTVLCQEIERHATSEAALLKRKHACPDWDYMVIDEDSPEFKSCLCYEGIDCTDEQLIEEVRRRGFVIRDAQIGREWVGLTDEEIKYEWEVWKCSLPRYIGFAKGIEAKLKEKNT